MEATQRFTNPLAHYSVLLFMYGVALLTLMTHILSHSAPQQHQHNLVATPTALKTADCPGEPAHTYYFSVTQRGIEPNQISAQRCDVVIFANHGGASISPALGPHQHHIDYPGLHDEQPIAPHETKSLRLSVAGTFPVHDHDNEGLRATLIVNK